MSEAIIVTLKSPIRFTETETIGELEFKAPTLGGLERLDVVTGQVKQLQTMISICTGLDLPRVKKISTDDFEQITEALGKLMPGGQVTGKT